MLDFGGPITPCATYVPGATHCMSDATISPQRQGPSRSAQWMNRRRDLAGTLHAKRRLIMLLLRIHSALMLSFALCAAGCGGTTNLQDMGSGGATTNTGGAANTGGSSSACTVSCPILSCPSGSTTVTKPGDCCPTCTACTVSCPAAICTSGFTPITQPGDCCPTCTACTVSCPAVICPSGVTAVTMVGDCCPTCVAP